MINFLYWSLFSYYKMNNTRAKARGIQEKMLMLKTLQIHFSTSEHRSHYIRWKIKFYGRMAIPRLPYM